jgi:hypothetical protein
MIADGQVERIEEKRKAYFRKIAEWVKGEGNPPPLFIF